MIRRVELQDAKAITTIYNEYVGHSVATFETEPLREEDMRNRIAGIAVRFPYFVYEEEGKVVGYCYAHLWKERAAYRHTLETTVYLAPGYEGKGIGRELMERLIEDVVVDEKYRGQGLSKQLVTHAVRFVKEQGIPLIMLTSNPTRIAANKLYQKLGFEQKQTNVYRMNLE
jgi:L-amino acid N-acyltransferase YncA